MKKKYFECLFVIVSFMAIACNYKTVTFKIYDKKTYKPIHYKASIPKGFKVNVYNTENERIKIFRYPDSSSFYFSTNTMPSRFFPDAYLKYGNGLRFDFISKDSLDINGKDPKGECWRISKIKYIVCGYRRVAPVKKALFDSIVDNIITKR